MRRLVELLVVCKRLPRLDRQTSKLISLAGPKALNGQFLVCLFCSRVILM